MAKVAEKFNKDKLVLYILQKNYIDQFFPAVRDVSERIVNRKI